MNNQFYKEFNINDEYDYSDFNADLEDYSDEELEDMQDEALDIYNREMDLLAGQDRSEQKDNTIDNTPLDYDEEPF